MLHKLQR